MRRLLSQVHVARTVLLDDSGLVHLVQNVRRIRILRCLPLNCPQLRLQVSNSVVLGCLCLLFELNLELVMCEFGFCAPALDSRFEHVGANALANEQQHGT